MPKINQKKIDENSSKKSQKIFNKKSQKIDQEISKNNLKKSRTMSWLKIPSDEQKKFKKNFISIGVDYLQYACYDISVTLKSIYQILWFTGEIDTDNSNVEYNKKLNLSLTYRDTRRGNAYVVTFLTPGFAPIPVASIEIYNPNQVKTLKTQWKAVFYGAYFVFNEIIKEEAPELIKFARLFELWCVSLVENNNKNTIYKRTRVDIATDVKWEISQKWMTKWIIPNKNSKETVKPYNYQEDMWWFQSFWYIPRLWNCIWMRVYNKILDINSKNKQSWYPEYGSEEIPNVMRMEIIYSWDSAMNDIDDLIEYTKFRLLWDEWVQIKRHIRPKSLYSPLSAYDYLKRYAKNHWKTIEELISDVSIVIEKNVNYVFSNFEQVDSGGSYPPSDLR